jgi:hypothetical protein
MLTLLYICSPAEFELFLEKPPVDQGPRWTGRPFRHYQVVHPPMPVNLEYTPTRLDKQRFVQNLWKAQALARTKLSASGPRGTETAQSTALPIAFVSNENKKLGGSDRLAGQAISFWNVWERDAWVANPRKVSFSLPADIGRALTSASQYRAKRCCMSMRQGLLPPSRRLLTRILWW